MTINEIWDEIEAWYDENVADAEPLNDGASDDEIADVEAQLGVELPAEVKESLQRHNGSAFGGWATGTLLECATIVADSQSWRQIVAKDGGADTENEDAELKPGWWRDAWVMIDKDADGSGYALDLDPADEGNIGQVIRQESDGGPSLSFDSFVEYLEFCLGELEEGEWANGIFVPAELADY